MSENFSPDSNEFSFIIDQEKTHKSVYFSSVHQKHTFV